MLAHFKFTAMGGALAAAVSDETSPHTFRRNQQIISREMGLGAGALAAAGGAAAAVEEKFHQENVWVLARCEIECRILQFLSNLISGP